MAKDKIMIMTLRADQTMTHSTSNSSLQRNVASRHSVNDDTRNLFVALFDYDPASVSSNSDAAEEQLPFKEQIL